MAERNSEYIRQDADAYWTPQWVYDALYAVEWFNSPVDTAPRSRNGYDFLTDWSDFHHIATNPPYKLADRFVRHAIDQTRAQRGKVAMLLPHAWDTAKKRRDLFELPPFKAKYAITTRIRWENLVQSRAGPSMNHAWYVWEWGWGQYSMGPKNPFMGWLPKEAGKNEAIC